MPLAYSCRKFSDSVTCGYTLKPVCNWRLPQSYFCQLQTGCHTEPQVAAALKLVVYFLTEVDLLFLKPARIKRLTYSLIALLSGLKT